MTVDTGTTLQVLLGECQQEIDSASDSSPEREDLLSTMLRGLLIPWGWRAARGCQHPSYSPLNHMQTTTLRPQGKPLPLPREAMPSAIATSAHSNPSHSPVQQPTRISAPLWSCRLYRLSPSLEAVSRTVRRTDMGHFVQCLSPTTDRHFHNFNNSFLWPASKPRHFQDSIHLQSPKFSSMPPSHLLSLMTLALALD